MASTPAAAPPPTNSSASAPPPTNSSVSAPPPTNSSASSTSPPAQPSPPPQSPSPPPPSPSPPQKSPLPASSPLPSPSPPQKSPLPASSPPPPRSPTAAHPPPSSPPPNPSSSSSSSPPPPKSGNVWVTPPPPSSKPQSPPSHKPPSSADGSDTPSENRHSGNSSGSLPVVIGVTAGVGILLVLMLVALVLCCCTNEKKKKKKPMAMDYYGTHGSNGGFNKGGSLPSWQHAEQRTDYRINLPPPPGATAFSPWHQSPPPPQAYSGGMSSTSSGAHSDGGTGAAALPPLSPNLAFSKSSFTFEALSAATGAFSRDNILGQGGFGFVYKGMLPNGVPVAVKQLKSGSGQGEREFQAEVEIISRVHHRHLVSLVGYCIAGAQRMLVYEFVPNNTLEYHLHVNDNPVMDWPTRLNIAIGSAKGLAYLHEDCHPRIIHRDIKSANILLDNNFEAMVADFGLAKFNSDTNTHVSTRIMGTFGYLSPEYASTGKLTEKSDVFSFGVMLLELITGRRPIDPSGYMEDSLVDWSKPLMTRALVDKNFDELVDKRLENKYNIEEMIRMVTSAAACVQHSARKRPKMSQVVRGLEANVSLADLSEGVKSGNKKLYNSSSDFDSGDMNSSQMREFKRIAFGSNEYNSDPVKNEPNSSD